MIRSLFFDKEFYKKLVSIALPISLQNLISSSLNMVDTVMIGQLGETSIASVGIANQVFFFFVLLLFGLNSGSAIFISQYWGKRDIINIRRVLGFAVVSGVFISVIFTVAALFFPEEILSLFSKDNSVIELGRQYLVIICFSYIITSITFSYSFASRSIGKAKLPMIVSAISLGLNTLLNYLLIFGNFGFPQLGVKGAAIATLIARTVELVLLLSIIYSKGFVLDAKIKEMLDLSKEFIKKILKTTTPVILNEAFWSLGIITYSAVYGRISTEAFASVQISNTVQQVFMVVSMGVGNACAVMIGNSIGANEESLAIDYAKRFSFITPIIGIIIGVFIVAFSPIILGFFDVSPVVRSNVEKILIIFAIFMAFKVFNTTLIIGILRGGGDTTFSLFLEAGSVWIVGVPLAIIGGHLLHLPVYWVVALVSLEEFVKALVGIPRIISKKWLRNVIEDI
ncbi:MATE family efflux transporter [Clostridium sp. D2Q-11]|uniref:Probable multidrug resistance protein NorM n=1 Tax=Anaeromonas frigoriresistens TaxID=2683708 RepID=A0A942Z8W6_9FIRM|nr:MATE family efflux transporter [Anaeromonas frigoriresistens]MBS4538703.1 MATE family efflux transporter [Anaeromonas frigoriresistens]